jgi:hypothetical protein
MSGPEMSLCSLEEVLAVCSEPSWIASDRVLLNVQNGSVSFDALRDLETSNIFVESISGTAESGLQRQYVNGVSGELKTGTTFELRLPRVIAESVVAKDLSDLLSIHSAAWQEPRQYFLIKEEESRKSFCFIGEQSLGSASNVLRRYHAALKLWSVVRGQAEHRTDTESLMFFGIRRTEIIPGFKVSDLAEDISLTSISDFLADRTATRVEIFRSVLSEFFRDQSPERAFGYLLRSSSLFARRLAEGLKIYLFANSPEKLAEEATAKHFELAEKLEKVITGMEAKSLTIPAAVLLAIKEVNFGQRWVTINTIILASAVLYFAAMTVAHFSQRSMLKLLKKTIDDSIKDLTDQGLDDTNPVLAVSFKTLKSRRRNSTIGSWIMWFFSIVPLIAIIYAAFCAPLPTSPTQPTP